MAGARRAAPGRRQLRRRCASVLATAALGLTGFVGVAGPARAASGPGASSASGASGASGASNGRTAGGPGFAMADPAPPPPPPAPLTASGPPQVQALVQKYEADAQADEQKYNQLSTEKGTLEQRAGDVTARENSLATQASNLKTRSDSLSGQVQALSDQIAAHNAEPHVFELPDEQAAYDAYNEEKASLDSQKAALQNQLDALTAQSDKLQADQAKAEADQTQLETDVQTHNDAVSALAGDVQHLAVERQQILAQIADLLQNYAESQEAQAVPPAAGADESAPPAAVAPPPQAQALPSGGGDQSAPPAVPYTQVGGTTAAPLVTRTPVTVTLAPSTVSGLPADQAENLSPTQTFDGLIPEPNGDYAAVQVQPPPGTPVPPAQKAFDDAVNKGGKDGKGGKATTPVGGKPATIDRVVPVSAAPAANQGGDTPKPAKAAPKKQPQRIWTPKHSTLVTPTNPPVSLSALPSLLGQNGLGDLAGQYDFELAPVIVDANGNPLLGSAPTDAAGNPLLGPTGKPIFRFSNLGLQDQDRALRAFTGDLVDSDLRLAGNPRFKEYKYITRPQLTSKNTAAYKYQVFATGQKYEEIWLLDGHQIEVDGGPGANNYIKEAKWTQAEGQWSKAGYNPAGKNSRFDEAKIVDQAARLLALNRALGGPGVIYYCSNPEGAAFFRAVLQEWFPSQSASGELQVEYLSAKGMRG